MQTISIFPRDLEEHRRNSTPKLSLNLLQPQALDKARRHRYIFFMSSVRIINATSQRKFLLLVVEQARLSETFVIALFLEKQKVTFLFSVANLYSRGSSEHPNKRSEPTTSLHIKRRICLFQSINIGFT